MDIPRLKQSTRLALKREAEDAKLLKQSEPIPEPSKGKRTAGDKLSDFPTTVYTDPECLQIIKDRDKNANDAYVKEFEAEISQKLSQS